MIKMITYGVLFKKSNNLYSGILYDVEPYNVREIKVICKREWNSNRFKVISLEDNKEIGVLIETKPERVRADKDVIQVAVMKINEINDYTFLVLEYKSKDGKVYYKVM